MKPDTPATLAGAPINRITPLLPHTPNSPSHPFIFFCTPLVPFTKQHRCSRWSDTEPRKANNPNRCGTHTVQLLPRKTSLKSVPVLSFLLVLSVVSLCFLIRALVWKGERKLMSVRSEGTDTEKYKQKETAKKSSLKYKETIDPCTSALHLYGMLSSQVWVTAFPSCFTVLHNTSR